MVRSRRSNRGLDPAKRFRSGKNIKFRLDPQHCSLADASLTLCVVSLGPVVAGPALSENKVVRSEDLSEGPRADAVHGAGFEVHKDGPGHILPTAGLVEVDIDPLQLQVGVAVVGAGRVNTVLIGDDFPELQ